MNSPLFFLAFFLLSSLSSAHRLDINFIPLHQSSSSSPSDDDAADPKIRLPTETLPAPDITQSLPTDRLVQLGFDLTDLINKRPVHLRNQLGVPFVHFLPRRCRHHNHHLRHPGRSVGLGPGFQVVEPFDDLASLFKKNAEVIRHRHVSGRFPEVGERMPMFEQSFIPLHRVHLDHHDVDPTVEVKTEFLRRHEHEEEHHHHHEHDHHHDLHDDETKRENDEEHHHHHDDHDEEKHEDKKDDVVNKIRKFLLNF